jgi:UDP-N-acetylglucosamine 2-epimerase
MSKSKKTIVSITGIRPDFIRMAEVFKRLDQDFNHILIHTGQHYDQYLTDVFFQQLHIRTPDYTLNTGKESKNHYQQLSYLCVIIPELLQFNNIKPDLIVFLGDSNTAAVSLVLKKEGYKICHIEAGMRSGDKRMLEEINRITCDHCSDLLFVYHQDYMENLRLENITDNVYVVGNTITEIVNKIKPQLSSGYPKDLILLDIHRPENFLYPKRLEAIIEFAHLSGLRYGVPVKILYFKRLVDSLEKEHISLKDIQMIPLMGYREYLETLLRCKFLISDSGTGQEEPALLGVPVVVPRDFTERPQSYQNNCSVKLCVEAENYDFCWEWYDTLENKGGIRTDWMGNGDTSKKIIDHIHRFLYP